MNRELLERVRARLAGSGDVPTSVTVATAVREETGGAAGDDEVWGAVRAARQELLGAGVLEPYLRDPEVTDVLVTAPDSVWLDRGDGLTRAAVAFPDENGVRRLATRLALSAGRRLDDAQPWVDAWLPPDGRTNAVRLHAILPPVAAAGTCLSLRILRPAAHDLSALRAGGAFSAETEALLREIVSARLAFLVSGGTGAGKTTLLGALLGAVPPGERIVCVESSSELHPPHPHVVRLITRQSNVEGTGAVELCDLVRQALRMRPDRLVVGEVRGAEVRDMLAAMNTGHEGSGGTVHANAPSEVPARVEALGALGGMPPAASRSQLAAAVSVVLHMRRNRVRGRHLAEIGVLVQDADRPRVVPAWRSEDGPMDGHQRLLALLRGGPA